MPQQEQDALQVVQAAKNNLLAQLSHLQEQERRLISGNNGAVSPSPAPGFSGSSATGDGAMSMPPQPRAPRSLGVQLGSGSQVDVHNVPLTGPPFSNPSEDSGYIGTRLASSLAALAQAQRREQTGMVSLSQLARANGSLPNVGANDVAQEVDAEFLRMALDGTLPLSSERPASVTNPGRPPQLGRPTSTDYGTAAAIANLQQQQKQQQQQQQQQQAHLSFLQQRAQFGASMADLPSRTLLQSQSPSIHSAHSHLNMPAHPSSTMQSHSSPLVTLPAYTTTMGRLVQPMQHISQPGTSSSSNAGWASGMHGGMGGTALHHVAHPHSAHVLRGQEPISSHTPGQSLQQWMLNKGVVTVPPQQQGLVLRASPSPPNSNPAQNSLPPGVTLQQHGLHQQQQQQLAAMQVIQGHGWQQTAAGLSNSGNLHGSPAQSLLTTLQPMGLSGQLYHTSPPQMQEGSFQQQLSAMAQATQIGAGGMVNMARSSTSFPTTRMAPTSASSTGSINSSKRSGASRRRKAKMYQALNAMVQVVVEQGGDQDVAEAAAAAAAATLKGGVPNLQGGSAACASVVQAVFQQRLQLQTALRQMQGAAQANNSNGSTGSRPQPLSHQVAMLQQQIHGLELQGNADLLFSSVDGPGSNLSNNGSGVGGASSNGRVMQSASAAEWPVGYAEALGAGEGEAGNWTHLLHQLLQADNTETSASSPTVPNSTTGKPFGDALSEDEDGDGDTLEATLDTEDLSFLTMGLANASMNGRDGPSRLGSSGGSGRPVMVVGSGPLQSTPPAVTDLRWPHVPSVSSNGVWAPPSSNGNGAALASSISTTAAAGSNSGKNTNIFLDSGGPMSPPQVLRQLSKSGLPVMAPDVRTTDNGSKTSS